MKPPKTGYRDRGRGAGNVRLAEFSSSSSYATTAQLPFLVRRRPGGHPILPGTYTVSALALARPRFPAEAFGILRA